jgi:hypothetical protein
VKSATTAEAAVATCHAKLAMAAQIADATGPHQQKAELVSLATTPTTALLAPSARHVKAVTHLAPVHAMVATRHVRVDHAMVAVTLHVQVHAMAAVTLHAATVQPMVHVMAALRVATTHLVASVRHAMTAHLALGSHAQIAQHAMTARHAETLTTVHLVATSVRAMVASVVRLVRAMAVSVVRSALVTHLVTASVRTVWPVTSLATALSMVLVSAPRTRRLSSKT